MPKSRVLPALLAAATVAAVAAPSASAAEIGQLCQANRSFTYNSMYVPKGGWVRILGYAGGSYHVRYTTSGGQVYTGFAVRSYVGNCKW